MFAATFRVWLVRAVVLALVGVLGFGATAQARTVNLSPAWVEEAEYSGLGAAPDDPGNTVWNTEPIRQIAGDGLIRTQTDLVWSDGSASSVGWSITGMRNDIGHINPHPDIALYHTAYWNLWEDSPAGQVEIFGLTNGMLYDVYLYSLVHDPVNGPLWGGTFTIGGTTLTSDADPWNHSAFVEGDNYVKFSDVSPSGGSIIVDITEYLVTNPLYPLEDYTQAWMLNGWQIQEVSEGFWRPGDASMDGLVNDVDTAILAGNWQTIGGMAWGDGDFNGDNNVDDIDATLLATNWTGTLAAVPEPSSLILLLGLLGLLGLGRFRR